MTRARDVANIDGILTTTGDTFYASAAATPARLGIGSSAQVLTVASGIPSWATPASGSFTKIQTTSFSAVANTSTSFDGVFTSTYKNYVLVFSNMYSSGSQQLLFQFRVSGVTRSAGYYGTYNTIPYNAGLTTTASNNVGSCQILNLQNSTGPAGMTLNVRTMGGASQEGQMYGIGWDVTVLGPLFTGYENTTAAINTGFILSVASGTVTGTVTVYGLEN